MPPGFGRSPLAAPLGVRMGARNDEHNVKRELRTTQQHKSPKPRAHLSTIGHPEPSSALVPRGEACHVSFHLRTWGRQVVCRPSCRCCMDKRKVRIEGYSQTPVRSPGRQHDSKQCVTNRGVSSTVRAQSGLRWNLDAHLRLRHTATGLVSGVLNTSTKSMMKPVQFGKYMSTAFSNSSKRLAKTEREPCVQHRFS